MWPNPQFSADLVTFTEEILNGKLLFLCSLVILMQEQKQLLEIMADEKEEMKMKETKDP